MADKIPFTVKALAALKAPGKGRAWYLDAKTPGLAVRVTATGAMTFYWRRWTRSGSATIRLGSTRDVTIEQARNMASELNGRKACGENVRRTTATEHLTLDDLWAWYLDYHARPHKRTWAEDERLYRTTLSKLGRRRLTDIDRADVQALHARLGSRNGHYAANRTLALLSAVFNIAGPGLGYDGPNPAKGVRRFREQSRDRFLDGDELRRLFAALDEETPLWRDFFRLLLLTGARRGNVLSMRWADLNLERGLWRIPESESKSGDPLVVVLVPAALDILKDRADARLDGAECVFPARRGDLEHASSPKTAWGRIRKRAGLPDVRMHDLRRTLGSWAAAAGASLPIIGRMLGHKSTAATMVYARLDLDPVRALAATATAAMLTAGETLTDDDDDGQRGAP